MGCSFANQVLAQMKLHAEAGDMELGVEVLSKELDEKLPACVSMRSTSSRRSPGQADCRHCDLTGPTSPTTTATECRRQPGLPLHFSSRPTVRGRAGADELTGVAIRARGVLHLRVLGVIDRTTTV